MPSAVAMPVFGRPVDFPSGLCHPASTGAMIGPGGVQSFLLKRLWEVGSARGAVWAMMAAHLDSERKSEMAMPRFEISGVPIEGRWSDLSVL